MEKYLMSSPTQLPHLFVGEVRAHAPLDESPPHQSHLNNDNNPHITNHNHHQHQHQHNHQHYNHNLNNGGQMSPQNHMSPTGYEELDFASELPDFSYEHAAASSMDMGDADHDARYLGGMSHGYGSNQHQNQHVPFVKGHSKHFSVDGYLQAPFALNAGSRFNFHHSRNVSLDDSAYRSQMVTPSRARHVPGHSHSMSLTSNSADPPSGTFSHSVSTSTFASMDSVPQLSSSMSNKSLLDSPYSSMGTSLGTNTTGGGVAATATTPGRRKLSTSLSSSQLYTTPLRGSVAQSPGVKVGKASVSHRRNRSRASLEPGSASLLASIANMKTSNSSSSAAAAAAPHGPAYAHNPFENSGYLSPSMGHSEDYEVTPLRSPGNNSVASMYFTPVGHSQNFGGSLHDSSATLASQTNIFPPLPRMHMPSHETPVQSQSQANFTFRLGPSLRRNDTFDSLHIEDQEDDACKQLRKAKSFTATPEARQMLSRSGSVRNMHHAHSPLIGNERSSFQNSASVDLLSPEVVGRVRNSALKSYPASIDLASITKSGMSTSAASPSEENSSGLLPPLPAVRSTSSIQTLSTKPLSESPSFTNLATKKASETYPNVSQIHEASATEEIAKYAESILNSDLKRPIVVHEESADLLDPKKKHKCPLCFARFQRPEHVKRHLKSHSSEKPFQCDLPDCGRRFNRKDNLKAHLRKIHGQSI